MARKRTADAQALQNAVKTLTANIRFASVDDPVRTICVASAIPSEGKTTTSVALGRAFAEGGSRVVLLEADMRRRSLATALGHHGRYGLYSVLAGEHSVQEAAIPVGTSKCLFFLDAEPGIPNPADVLQSKRFHSLLTQLSSQFDYVIVRGVRAVGPSWCQRHRHGAQLLRRCYVRSLLWLLQGAEKRFLRCRRPIGGRGPTFGCGPCLRFGRTCEASIQSRLVARFRCTVPAPSTGRGRGYARATHYSRCEFSAGHGTERS